MTSASLVAAQSESAGYSSDPSLPTAIPVIGFAVLAVVAVTAAMLNALSIPLVGGLTVALSAVAVRWIPDRVTVRGERTKASVWLVLSVLVVTTAAWNASHASELVITGRDGATYLNIAKGLSQGDSLRPTQEEPPFAGHKGLEYASPGWESRPDGTAYPQFLHAMPAVWAIAGILGGDAALVGANAVVAGLTLWTMFGLLRRWLRQWAALGAVATFAICLPMVYFSRSSFTEPASLLLLWGGLWLAAAAFDRPDAQALARLAGFTIGTTFVTRIDGWLYGLAIAVTALLWKSRRERAADRTFDGLWWGFLAAAAVGMIDLLVFSLPYLGSHRSLLLPLIVGSFVVRILAGSNINQRSTGGGSRIAAVLADPRVLSGLYTVFALFVLVARPLWFQAYGESYGLADLEAAAGLPAATGRTYGEYAGHWPAWYLGWPALILAAYLGYRSLRSGTWNQSPISTLITSVLVFGAGVYLVLPSANPDHIWVMRRFLPVLIPAIVAATWGVLDYAFRAFAPAWFRGAVVGIACSLVAWSGWVTAPLALTVDNAGSLQMINRLCDQIDGRPTLLIGEESDSIIAFAEPIRQWCGVSVAYGDVNSARRAIDGLPRGVMVYAVTGDVLSGISDTQTKTFSAEVEYISSTLFSPPRTVQTARVRLNGAVLAG